MRTKDSAIKYAKKYLKAAQELNIKVNKAFLFGSYANGSQTKYSDIDLALISEDLTDNRLKNWKRLAPANIKYHLVEPHLFTWDDYRGNNAFLVEEIKAKGLEIPVEDQ